MTTARGRLERLGIALLTLAAAGPASAEVKLPGTQPGDGVRIESVDQCRMCHGGTRNGEHDPFRSWAGGMMAQSARDPVFLAALTIAEQDVPGVGDFCLRCHAPAAFFAGRTTDGDYTRLKPADRDGVSCSVCHRLLDPQAPTAAGLVQKAPPGLGNAMMVVDPGYVMHGPYADSADVKMRPHRASRSEFLASGDFCGTCHNVSNPLQAEDPARQPPHAYGHVERTYSEWKLSEYARRGREGRCQHCHYPEVAGGGWPTRLSGNPKRDYFVTHGPVGGSTWVQQTLPHFWPDDKLDREALERARAKTRRLLRTAATLKLAFPSPGKARLRVINETGHKLPTGYPEGRRMWINIRCYDGADRLLRELGRYGEKADSLQGEPVTLPTLLDPEQTRVYECLPALSPEQARQYNLPPGPSFFFVLNDVIAKDNRIPPRGFNNKAFAEHHCEPVGAEYADGQYWDDFDFDLPAGTRRVDARLMYQSVSAEYVKFFVEAEREPGWGRKVYEIWRRTGHCPPETIAELSAPVPAPAP